MKPVIAIVVKVGYKVASLHMTRALSMWSGETGQSANQPLFVN